MFTTHRARGSALRAEHYGDPEFHRRELECLFEPAWLPVGLASDVPESGSFLTTELLGVPLVIRNDGDTIRAFRNLCAHRRCLVRSEPRGRQAKLRCQFHGWTYDDSGSVSAVPFASSYDPVKLDRLKLREYPLEACGQLLFVRIAREGPSLKEFLGDHFAFIAQRCAPQLRPFFQIERSYPVNWKIAHENQLEDTHSGVLHATSFGAAQPEDRITTWLGDRSARYHVAEADPSLAPWPRRLVANWVRRHWGCLPLGHNVLDVFPTLHFVWEAEQWPAFSVSWLIPTGPRSCRHHMSLLFADPAQMTRGQRRTWPGIQRDYTRITEQVLGEDASIYAAAQAGMDAAHDSGVLGVREERIRVFQDWLLGALDEAPVAEPG